MFLAAIEEALQVFFSSAELHSPLFLLAVGIVAPWPPIGAGYCFLLLFLGFSSLIDTLQCLPSL